SHWSPVGKAYGYASLVCSLSFWILGPLSAVGALPEIELSFKTWAVIWLAIWTLGFVLAVIAVLRVSRLWAIAAILPLANVLLIDYIMSV
ncbi:MAG TPA: hypothetical protein VKD65_07995, partial [Candidatus Angelobacter sp.]|nr:hypothetical protein [Candidatus Angelobacter sp.]